MLPLFLYKQKNFLGRKTGQGNLRQSSGGNVAAASEQKVDLGNLSFGSLAPLPINFEKLESLPAYVLRTDSKMELKPADILEKPVSLNLSYEGETSLSQLKS